MEKLHDPRLGARPSSLGGKGVNFHPPAPAPLPPGILLPSLYGAAHTCMVRAVLYCTVLRKRKGRSARGAEKFSRSARARTGEKVHKSSRILHALLKKTCKTGVCLVKFGKIFRALRECLPKLAVEVTARNFLHACNARSLSQDPVLMTGITAHCGGPAAQVGVRMQPLV